MKIFIFLITLALSATSTADTIKKWTDKDGTVHYGDQEAAENVDKAKSLNIDDTFDQQAYEEGVERHKEVEEFGDKLEKSRIEEAKQEAEEERLNRPAPVAGRTTIINPTLSYGVPYRYPSRGYGNIGHPVQLPAITR
jgi:hypothetical protein